MNEEEVFWENRDGFGVELKLKIKRRLWRIDKIHGKAVVLIELRNPETKEVVDYCLSYVDLYKIIDAMFQVELENDLYIFRESIYGKEVRRPTQIFKEIQNIEEKLREWREKAKAHGLGRVDLSRYF